MQSLDELPFADPELGCVIKDEASKSLYIKLKPTAIPRHWCNDPELLQLDSFLAWENKKEEKSIMRYLKSEFEMPNPVPIIKHRWEEQWLIAGSNWKYYLWEGIEGAIREVYKQDLAKILETFRQY